VLEGIDLAAILLTLKLAVTTTLILLLVGTPTGAVGNWGREPRNPPGVANCAG
jgi:ABC-type molybdate transport system permease subunit